MSCWKFATIVIGRSHTVAVLCTFLGECFVHYTLVHHTLSANSANCQFFVQIKWLNDIYSRTFGHIPIKIFVVKYFPGITPKAPTVNVFQSLLIYQWSFLVPIKGGREHITPPEGNI